jgi:hypothetical protein
MKPQVYKDPRPAKYFDQFHEAARKGVGWTHTLARIILTVPTILIYRVRAIGVENVPKQGPLVLAPNHFSQMDHFFAGVYLRRKIRFMPKSGSSSASPSPSSSRRRRVASASSRSQPRSSPVCGGYEELSEAGRPRYS